MAAAKGFELVVAILLQHGARVDATNKRGWTALHFGAQSGNTVVVESLIKHHDGIDVPDGRMDRPLFEALNMVPRIRFLRIAEAGQHNA
jgi:ankyrin repeat protein